MSYICERCGKLVEDADKFGSGRFCSRACANTRNHSAETKERIRQGVNKQTICHCQFCGKEFNNLSACRSHERLCISNPNKIEIPSGQHRKKLQRPVTLYIHNKGIASTKVSLNITYGELEQYRQNHTVCEICGRAVSEVTKWDSKYAAKALCIDHDHSNNTFRGLLCQHCNRQLGWYENNRDKIKEYLGE